MTVKLSKTSKMPCKSWSLEAIKTCPGSRESNGELVPVCRGCYANSGFYKMTNAVNLRRHNRDDWKRDGWVADMVAAINDDGSGYFRWFDSGDVYCTALAEKIYEVIRATPKTQHWIPTRSYKIPRIRRVLSRIRRLKNASVRYSSDAIDEFKRGTHGSVVTSDEGPHGATLCPAYTNAGRCGDCRACWDRSISVIAYPAHGSTMLKQIST